MYIVFEGMDYTGKTGAANFVGKKFGIKVVKPPFGDKALDDKYQEGLGGLDLTISSFNNHTKVIELLAENETLISDRNIISELVYNPEGNTFIEENIKKLPTPDITVLVEIDFNSYLNRMAGRNDVKEIEKLNREEFNERRERYRRFVFKHSKAVLVVNNSCFQFLNRTSFYEHVAFKLFRPLRAEGYFDKPNKGGAKCK